MVSMLQSRKAGLWSLGVGLLAFLFTLPISGPLGYLAGNAQAVNLTWVGGDATNPEYWDIATSANWSGGATVYNDADNVTFDDNGLSYPNVDLTTTLSPGSVTVNSSSPYSFSGAGSLAGATGINKSGDGMLTVNTANTFDGVVNVTGGTFIVGNATALGSNVGGTVVNGGTLELNGLDLKDPGDTSKFETVTVQGAGVDSLGAVVNNTNATGRIHNLVLSGDATFGGSDRLGIWGDLDSAYPGVTPVFGDYTITVNHTGDGTPGGGYDAVRIVNTYGHTLKDANVVQGTLAFHNADLGQASGTITVTHNPTAMYVTTLQLMDSKTPYDGSENSVNKNLVFTGGQLYVYRGKFSVNATSGTMTLNDMPTDVYVHPYHTTYLTELSIDGSITGDGGINKIGGGTLGLTAANSYTGATTVTAGTLRVDGSITSDTTVMADAHLDGSGSIVGNVTVEVDGYIEPGTSIGTLTIDGALDLDGTLAVEYDSDTDTIDLLEVVGLLDLTDATFSFSDYGAGTMLGGDYVFATYGSLTGNPATYVDLPEGWSVEYDYGGTGDRIALHVVGTVQIPGDTDGDLVVDETDAGVLADNWGTNVGTGGYGAGDFNGDTWVNAIDAAIQAANWGDHNPLESATGVPEPSTLVLLALGLVSLAASRRRRS